MHVGSGKGSRLAISNVGKLFCPQVFSSTNGQICDKLMKNTWLPYDVSSVDSVPGIYAIGEKRRSGTKYLYVGRSNDVKRRLQEHKSQNRQDIDKKVTEKFKRSKDSELRIKHVPEKNQKSKEGAYMQCMKEKIGYRPVLNKREGDGCASCASGRERSEGKSTTKHKPGGSKKSSSSKTTKQSPSKTHVRPKVVSGRSSSSTKMPSRPPSRSSGGPKVSSAPSSRSSGSPKVSSGRSSFRSSSGPKVSSGRSSFRSSGRRK